MEIINGQETSMDVKRRMEKELMELRRQRLSEKDNDIQKLNQRRFFESADELRKNDSQAFAVECYLEQENQMLDKMRRREKEKQEEMFYVKLNELDNMKKIENEKKMKKNTKILYRISTTINSGNEIKKIKNYNTIMKLVNSKRQD